MKKNSIFKILSITLAMIFTLAMLTASACTPEPEPPKEYTISYVLGGDTANPATNHPDNPSKYTNKELPITIQNPTREGYDFIGWTSERHKNKSKNIKLGSSTAQNLTFTAHWVKEIDLQEDEYLVRLYANMDDATFTIGGESIEASDGFVYKEADLDLTIVAQFSTNRKFEGWFNDNGTKVGTSLTLTISTAVTDSFTAMWEEEKDSYKKGKIKAPDFELRKVKPDGTLGETVKLSDYYGEKSVFITFWQYSCNYCTTEMRDVFNPIYDSIKDKTEILAIHSKLDMAGLKQLLKDNSFDYKFPVLDDNGGDVIGKGFYTTKYPANYMVDRWGYLYSPNQSSADVAIIKYAVGTITAESQIRSIIESAQKRADAQ